MSNDETDPMNGGRIRLAIAEITATLTTDFDLPTLLDTVAHNAQMGLEAHSAVVLLLDHRHHADDAAIQIVAQAERDDAGADLTFQGSGPGLLSARDGAVTMIADLADTEDTRWPGYCHYALGEGMRGMRAFPVTALGTPLGSVVVHTDEPWGTSRPNDFGQILADLTAIALSGGPTENRRADMNETITELLHGITVIATATGIIAETLDLSAGDARRQLRRLARSHGHTVTTHARAVLTAQDTHPEKPAITGVFRPPPDLTPPQHIDR